MNVHTIVLIFLLFFTSFIAKADTVLETAIVDAGIEVFVPNQREIKFWELLRAHPEHGRDPRYTYLDPLLCKVARAHSRDMFENAYFAHTNLDGVSANRRLHDAGWNLCPQYDLDSNQVESIADLMTYNPVKNALDLFLRSPGHRNHILAEGELEKESTAIGIGIYRPPLKEEGYAMEIVVFLSVHPDPERYVACKGPQIALDLDSDRNSTFYLKGDSLTVGAPYMIQYSNTVGNWKPYILIRPTRRVEGLVPLYRTTINEEQQTYFRVGFLYSYPPRDFYWAPNTYVDWPPENPHPE